VLVLVYVLLLNQFLELLTFKNNNMKNIFLLATNEPSRLWMNTITDKLELSKNSDTFNAKNIYITFDGEIKENEWVISNGEMTKASPKIVNSQGLLNRKAWKKVILTTDPTLIADGIQAIDDTFLEWFVKNPSCEFVEVEENILTYKCSGCGGYYAVMSFDHISCDSCYRANGYTTRGITGIPDKKEFKIIIPQEEPKYVSSGGAKYVFGTVKGEYTIGNPSPNTAKGEFALAMGYNPETTNRAEGHHSIVIGNGLTSTKPYQLLVDRNGVKIDKIMTIEEYELLSQVLKSINDIKI
jgi:hypothetical protein